MGRRRDVKRRVAGINMVLDLGERVACRRPRRPSFRVAPARAGEAVSKSSTAASSADAIAFIRRWSSASSLMVCCKPLLFGNSPTKCMSDNGSSPPRLKFGMSAQWNWMRRQCDVTASGGFLHTLIRKASSPAAPIGHEQLQERKHICVQPPYRLRR